jgi:transposase
MGKAERQTGRMDVLALLPCGVSLHLEALSWRCERLHLRLRTTAESARCPLCSHLSTRVHSCYRRTLADLPCCDLAVQLEVTVHKFFCDHPDCRRRIFTQPLPQLAARYARRTLRLQEVLQWLGLTLGGQAGARLTQELHLNTSPDTILRAVQSHHENTLATPRVLGVDDFAFRRGRIYGTILVDLEEHRVVDLLPDREAQTLTDWLKQHPGIQVISRDRATAYAQGAREGAPHAVQIADRWHLLKNLTDALEKVLLREHRAVREVASFLRDGDTKSQADLGHTPASLVSTLASTSADEGVLSTKTISPRWEQDKEQRRQRRLARYEQVRALFQQGMTIRGIARATRLSRKTVRRFVQAAEFPERAPGPPRPTKLDAFTAFLVMRWKAGCHNATQLYGELRAQGYSGGLTLVRDYLHQFRAPDSVQIGAQQLGRPTPALCTMPSPRTVLWWLLRPDDRLEDRQRQFVARLCQGSPAVGTARELALWFFRMVRERRAEEFGEWITTARQSGIAPLNGFASKLLCDRAAVVAGLSQVWSNGQTEGQVNRLKLIKRQMYGRASFDLLRAKVLASH